MADNKKVHYRITAIEAVFILLVTVILDIVSIFPAANEFTDWIGNPLVAAIFGLNGVNIFGSGKYAGRKVALVVADFIIEAIPVASIIPTITIEAIANIIISRIEDKTHVPIMSIGSIKKIGSKEITGVVTKTPSLPKDPTFISGGTLSPAKQRVSSSGSFVGSVDKINSTSRSNATRVNKITEKSVDLYTKTNTYQNKKTSESSEMEGGAV